jgi:hypothetical protein
MNEEQFAEATAGTTPYKDVNCRCVGNGYVLNGQVRYVNETTQQVVVAQQFEAIAADHNGAAAAVATFLSTGKF